MAHRQYLKKIDPLVQYPPATYCPANNHYDISDATATEPDVLVGKTFYAGDIPKKTGTMPNIGSFSDVIDVVAEEINPPLGYHDGTGIIKIAAVEQAKIIPGNIKKDVTILGVTGTLETSPAVICPANGYIPDPYVYTLPVTLPVQPGESILHVCDATKGNWLGATYHNRVVWNNNGGSGVQCVYDLYDAAGVFINTRSSAATYLDFAFPANDRYYTVIQRLSYAPAYFTGYYNNDSTPKYNNDCVESVIVNSTHITQFNCAFRANLKSCTFLNNGFNTLTAITDLFKCCTSLKAWSWPQTNCPNIVTAENLFAYSGIVNANYSNISLPNATYVHSWFAYSRFAENIIMPTTMYGNRLGTPARDTLRLVKLIMPTALSVKSGAPTDYYMAYAFYNSSIEGELILPPYPACTSIDMIIGACKYLTTFRMKGSWEGILYSTTPINGCIGLVTFEAPRIVNRTASMPTFFDTTTTALKYYIAPDIGYIPLSFTISGLVSITGDQDTSGFATKPQVTLDYNMYNTLAVFNSPKLQVAKFTMTSMLAYRFTLLTSINIDWAGSTFSAGGATICANLDATELNRIMGLLPAMAKTLDIRYCTGYATCDKTIATAKGWTVL